MHWLSKPVESLIDRIRLDESTGKIDVLVVGSGYGGSVAALRFAQAGFNVTLLERGAEYLAGDFPVDLSQVGGFVRAEVGGEAGGQATVSAMGYEEALFDFRLGTRASALVGNGLGGGSLINAAVALRPDPGVFAQVPWPASLLRDGLDADFDAAWAGLEINSPSDQKTSEACVPQATQKYKRLMELGQAAQAKFSSGRLSVSIEDVPLAIEFRKELPTGLGPRAACVGCGDCCSGCNHDAKLSLNKTYLPRAFSAGAEMFTGVSVLSVQHQPLPSSHGFDWVVSCIRTSERGKWEQACKIGLQAAYVFTLRASRVVLAAGTFGSTEILLRSHSLGLAVAQAWLGKGISANGDDLSAAFDLKKTVNGVGQGSSPQRAQQVGPTISGLIRFHDDQDPKQSTITEDGGIPGMLNALLGEILSTLGTLPQLKNFGMRARGQLDPLGLSPQAVQRSMALLGMGHDSASGQAQMQSASGRLSWGWPENAKDPAPHLHRQRMTCVEDCGAEFLPNPASGVLPDKIASVLSGPKIEGGWVTVHPLGGCRMGSSPSQGVVNDLGQVYLPDGRVHVGLMVMDGSIIASSLGVNPMLTITALAERACRIILANEKDQLTQSIKAAVSLKSLPFLPPKKTLLLNDSEISRGAVLSEVLRGELRPHAAAGDLVPWLRASGSDQAKLAKPAALFLEMQVADWLRLWQDPEHSVRPKLDDDRLSSFTRSRLVIDDAQGNSTELRVTGGQVKLFIPLKASRVQQLDRFFRSGLTYWVARWGPDRKRPGSNASLLSMIWDAGKLLWHASAARAFEYRLDLNDGGQPLRLIGHKRIEPALRWSELLQWAYQKFRQGGWPVPLRRSVWQQLTELDVQIFGARSEIPLAEGRLAMDLPEMVRRVAPQIQPGGDTLNAMAAMASYPMILMRYLITSRLLDFRLPDYWADLPEKDPVKTPDDGLFELAHDSYPPLILASGLKILSEPPVCLTVALKAGKRPSDPGTQTIRLGLVRYAQSRVDSELRPQGIRRYKSILLLNGFAQNTLPFVAQELGHRNLAAMLYAQGWDVWLFEYRVSPLLRASASFSSMDDIGACDIPAAVDYMLESLQLPGHHDVSELGQIFVFSHCVGSASMGMSLLGGHLEHDDQTPKVAGVLFSQFQPYVIGSVTAQMRLQVAALMVNVLGLESIEFAAGTCQPDGLHALFDRLFATLNVDPDECCPGESDLRQPRPDTTTCKRMTGLLSRLYRHDQLVESSPGQPGTHEKLDQYFGRTNLGVFLHGAKCVEYERLVDADGQNIYVTDENVRRYLAMPVMLLHGEDNVLFDKASLDETWRQLSRAFGHGRLQTKHDRVLMASGHAHFDCTIGKRAPELIFPQVIDFFNNALVAEVPEQEPHNRLRARLPRTGPIAGWRREEGGKTLQRVWIEVDNSQADEAISTITMVCAGKYRCVQAWPLSRQPLEGLVGVSQRASPDMSVTYAVADLELPEKWSGPITVFMLSLHRLTAQELSETDLGSIGTIESQWPREWGSPITLQEVVSTGGRSPVSSVLLRLGQNSERAEEKLSFFHNPSNSRSEDRYASIDVLPFQDVQRITPLPLSLSWSDAKALTVPLSRLVQDQRKLALRADPQTLSRQRRALRSMREGLLRLRHTSLETFRTVRFFAATCRHPGLTELESLRSDHTLQALSEQQKNSRADLMWMLGDQIYADARAGLLDSESTIERLLPRYRKAFGSDAFRALARTLPLYMVMDDHEISDNWSRDDEKLDPGLALLSRNAIKAFAAYQRVHGPPALGPGGHDGICTLGQAAFLSLNTRIHRNRALGKNQTRQILHPEQWSLLEDWLHTEQSKGNGGHPKFIVTGSVFAPGLAQAQGNPSPRDTDSWQLVQAERSRLLAMIAKHQFRNVVFLSGDYHCSASATIEFEGSNLKAYALVAPPLYAPLRFANVMAQEVMQKETIAWANGRAYLTAKAFNGEGWLECELQESTAGCLTLHNHFRTHALDAPEPRHCTISWDLA